MCHHDTLEFSGTFHLMYSGLANTTLRIALHCTSGACSFGCMPVYTYTGSLVRPRGPSCWCIVLAVPGPATPGWRVLGVIMERLAYRPSRPPRAPMAWAPPRVHARFRGGAASTVPPAQRPRPGTRPQKAQKDPTPNCHLPRAAPLIPLNSLQKFKEAGVCFFFFLTPLVCY